MKLLVLSDTHGTTGKAAEICRQVSDADAIIHLGDNIADAARIQRETQRQVIRVNGNCDYGSAEDDFKVLETEYGDIFLTHGHRQSVKYGETNLIYRTLELGCKAVFFGHTHVALFKQTDGGIYMLNPGSLSLPRDGKKGSYAVVITSKEGLEASVIYPQ